MMSITTINKAQNPSLDETNTSYTYAVGASRLEGTVQISGAKNSVLRLLAASLLTSEKIVLQDYPAGLRDAQIHLGMLEALGKRCYAQGSQVEITETHTPLAKLEWSGRSIRNTLLILGALLARGGEGAVPLPGGCNLGERKYDLHELVFRRLGAEVWTENDMLCAKAPGRLQGNDIYLPIRSTGATENAILCGSLAEGVTRIWNPHIRPEILDLIKFLQSMGARIKVFGQEHIEIVGVESLTGTQYTVIPDNMEAITWLIGSVITKGDVEIINFPYEDLEVPLIHLRESGAKFYTGKTSQGKPSLIVRGGRAFPVEISTGPYPGINSDMQPLFAVYGACARGESRIVDLRFPGRYAYADELAKLGVQTETDGNMLKIMGGAPLKGGQVKALDLRAGIALTLAGLTASGTTYIQDAWQVERGYNNFVEKLQSLGGDISYG